MNIIRNMNVIQEYKYYQETRNVNIIQETRTMNIIQETRNMNIIQETRNMIQYSRNVTGPRQTKELENLIFEPR